MSAATPCTTTDECAPGGSAASARGTAVPLPPWSPRLAAPLPVATARRTLVPAVTRDTLDTRDRRDTSARGTDDGGAMAPGPPPLPKLPRDAALCGVATAP